MSKKSLLAQQVIDPHKSECRCDHVKFRQNAVCTLGFAVTVLTVSILNCYETKMSQALALLSAATVSSYFLICFKVIAFI